jgi:hypothetical protein
VGETIARGAVAAEGSGPAISAPRGSRCLPASTTRRRRVPPCEVKFAAHEVVVSYLSPPGFAERRVDLGNVRASRNVRVSGNEARVSILPFRFWGEAGRSRLELASADRLDARPSVEPDQPGEPSRWAESDRLGRHEAAQAPGSRSKPAFSRDASAPRRAPTASPSPSAQRPRERRAPP